MFGETDRMHALMMYKNLIAIHTHTVKFKGKYKLKYSWYRYKDMRGSQLARLLRVLVSTRLVVGWYH